MTELRQRRPRVHCPGFLEFLRQQPCCACGAGGRSQAAHIRMPCLELDKDSTGMAEKPDDRWAVSLCGPDFLQNDPGCHAAQHSGNEAEFWRRLGRDPFAVAARLFARYLAERGLRDLEDAQEAGSESRAPKRRRRAKRSQTASPRPPQAKRKLASRANPWPTGRKIRSRGFRK